MCVQVEGRPSPLELHTGVVAFRLRQQRDPHDESERAAEVFERELAGQAAGAVALQPGTSPVSRATSASESGGVPGGYSWQWSLTSSVMTEPY